MVKYAVDSAILFLTKLIIKSIVFTKTTRQSGSNDTNYNFKLRFLCKQFLKVYLDQSGSIFWVKFYLSRNLIL